MAKPYIHSSIINMLITEVASPISLVVSWRSPHPYFLHKLQITIFVSFLWQINNGDDDDDGLFSNFAIFILCDSCTQHLIARMFTKTLFF